VDIPTQSEKPNVLFICVDQWGAHLTRQEGHPCVKTPTMSQLAQSSVTYSKTYAETPSCVPACRVVMTKVTEQLIKHLYGDDLSWIKNGKLTGLPTKAYSTPPNRGLAGQRGVRFL